MSKTVANNPFNRHNDDILFAISEQQKQYPKYDISQIEYQAANSG